MKDFLRNNGKIIMTILSIALMLVFAMPAMNGKTADSMAGATVATLNGRKISSGTRGAYHTEIQILRQLDLIAQPPYSSPTFPLSSDLLNSIEEDKIADYWIMISNEALNYSHAAYSLADVASVINPPGRAPIDIRAVMKAAHMSDEDLLQIVQRLDAVESYLRYVMSVPQPISQLELMTDRFTRSVEVALAEIDGTAGWEAIPPPSDADIAAHFAAYKSQVATVHRKEPLTSSDGTHNYQITRTDTGLMAKITTRAGKVVFEGPVDKKALTGESLTPQMVAMLIALASPPPQAKEINGHTYPFGYKFPDRVKVEWLKLDRAAIKRNIPVTREDQVEAMQFVRNNPETVRQMILATRPAAATTSAPATTAGATSAPATQPELPSDPTALYTLARDLVIESQITEPHLERVMKEMLDDIARRAAPARNAPANAPPVPYQDIAAAAAAAPTFRSYKPEYGTTERLIPVTELQDLPGIGDTFAVISQRQVPFHLLPANVQELVTLDKENVLNRLNLRKNAEGPIVRDAAGNAYIYRVVEAEKSHEPAGLDDVIRPGVTVKAKVIEDLKKLKAYEARVAAAKEAAAKAADLAALAGQFKAEVYKPGAFSRLEADRNVVPLEVAAVRGLSQKAFTLKPTGIEISPSDTDLKLAALNVVKVNDSTGLDFAGMRNSFLAMPDPQVAMPVQGITMRPGDMPQLFEYFRPGPFMLSYMSYDALKKRTNYRLVDEPSMTPEISPQTQPETQKAP